MLSVTFQSQLVRLVTEQPEWGRGGVAARISVPTSKTRGLTGCESRRPLGGTLRVDLRWHSVMLRSDVDALRNELQVDSSAGDVPFVTPFWPAVMAGSLAAGADLGSAGLWVGWDEDGSGWVVTDDPVDLAELDHAAPGLWGRLELDSEALEVEVVRARFRFQEDGPAAYALDPSGVTWVEGPALSDGHKPKLFPFPVEWSRDPLTGSASVEVDRQPLGPGRELASSYFPQNAERSVAASVSLLGATELARFLRWWCDRRGDVESHYVNTLTGCGGLGADASAGATAFTPVDASRCGTNGILILGDGWIEEWVRVTEYSGGSAQLSAPLVGEWLAGGTFIQLGMLARHARNEVEIFWEMPGVASARVTWKECRGELVTGSGETRGATIGSMADTAWLYELSIVRAGAVSEVRRLTSWDQNLTAAGHTWAAWMVEHSEIRQSMALDRDEVTLRLRYRDPLDVFLPGRLDAVVRVAIFRCTVSGSTGSSVGQLYGGEARRFTADGPFCSVSFAGANALFDRRVPRYLMQRGCNHRLFDARCGLSLSDWDLNAYVYAVSGASVTLESFFAVGSAPAGWGAAHWFALGYLQRANGSRLLILDSQAKDGSGRVALTLVSAPGTALEIGETVMVLPGCDGDAATCSAKFGNQARHGGFPWLPDKEPTFQPIRRDEGAGKK